MVGRGTSRCTTFEKTHNDRCRKRRRRRISRERDADDADDNDNDGREGSTTSWW